MRKIRRTMFRIETSELLIVRRGAGRPAGDFDGPGDLAGDGREPVVPIFWPVIALPAVPEAFDEIAPDSLIETNKL